MKTTVIQKEIQKVGKGNEVSCKQLSFTLIKLLVVIAIIAILAFMLLPALCLLTANAVAADAAETSYEPFETVYAKEIAVKAFYPRGLHGVFKNGEEFQWVFALENRGDKPVAPVVTFVLKDLSGAILGEKKETFPVLGPKKSVRQVVTMPASRRNGYFTVNATITLDGEKAAESQTSVVVLPPFEGERDTFFAFDSRDMTQDLVDSYPLVGVGTIGISFQWGDYFDAITGKPAMGEDEYVRKCLKHFENTFKSDCRIITYISPVQSQFHQAKTASYRRIQEGGAIMSDEDFALQMRLNRKFIDGVKKHTWLWVLQEELDAMYHVNLNRNTGRATELMADYVRVARALYGILKNETPDRPVGVLGNMGSDMVNSDRPMDVGRMILKDLGDCFDLVCIDAYAGNYRYYGGALTEPEVSLRNFYLEASKLAREFNRPKEVINTESSYTYPRNSKFDLPIHRQVADLTARSFVIARSADAKVCVGHYVCYEKYAFELRRRQTREKGTYRDDPVFAGINRETPNASFADFGYWKSVYDENDNYAYVPHPMVMAYASAARELAFVSEPVEVILDQGVYAYAFRRSNKERVIAIWTREDKPVNFEISLPSDSHIVDMMCNRSELKKGKNTLLLSNSPQYLTVQCENGEDAVKMLRAGMYPDAEPLKAAGRRLNAGSALLLVKSMSGEPAECSVEIPGQAPLKATLRPKEVNEITASADAGMKGNVTAKVTAAGKTLEVPLDLSYVSVKRIASAPEFDGRLSWAKGLVPVRLKTPDDIYPKAALIPERGLFKNDGTDISADLYFAWDEANLYLAAEVKDPVHIQRRGGQEMSLDDSLQFVISKRFNALPKALRSSKIVPLHTPEDYSINLTRTARGPDMVKYMGGSPNATSEFKYNVLRRDNKTVYEFAFPWDCIGLKPAPGASFLYGVMISDTNDIRHACAQYQLLFADGVRGDCRDVTLLKTMVLEK